MTAIYHSLPSNQEMKGEKTTKTVKLVNLHVLNSLHAEQISGQTSLHCSSEDVHVADFVLKLDLDTWSGLVFY